MADVGLDRPDQQRAVPSGAICRPGGLGLDRIADRCARAMGLHVVHVRGLYARPGQGIGDHLLLGLAVRDSEALAGTVLVQCRAPDHAPYPVAIGLGVAEPLQYQDPAALASHVAVGSRIEGLASPVRRQHPRVATQLEEPARQDGVHPAGQGEVGLAPLEPGHCLMHRRQRRRAGRVHGHGRTPQPQHEGDSPDGGVERGARDRVEAGRGFRGVVAFEDEGAVLVVAYARVDPGTAALEPIRIDAGVLQGLPAHFQHQPLLRIEQLRLHRGDAEEGRVELIDPVDEGAEPASVVLDGGAGKQFADATLSRPGDSFGDGADAVVQ